MLDCPLKGVHEAVRDDAMATSMFYVPRPPPQNNCGRMNARLLSVCICVAGFGVGRLRVYHQPDPAACVCAAADATLQPESLHR